MKTWRGVLGAAAILVASCCPSRTLPVMQELMSLRMPVEKLRLANGLEVIFHEDHRSPQVAVNVWYHVGSKDEPPRRHGFAHLFEHLMFQGSRNVRRNQFHGELARAGASAHNGTTNEDRTEYFETVPADKLDVALWLESDRMGFLLDGLDQANFEREREVVKNERRQRYENVAHGLVPMFIREALYPDGHPYRHLAIGTPEDLDAATLDDVRAFWRTFYRPDNATLVIAGDIDRAAAHALVVKYFGGIEGRSDRPVERPAPPVSLDRERRLVVEAGVELAHVAVTWPAPPAFTPGDAELELAEAVVRGRLVKELSGIREWTQHIGVHHTQGQLGGRFEIRATLRSGVSPEKVLAVIDEELDDLKRRPIPGYSLREERARAQSALLFDFERVTERARRFNEYNQLARDPGFVNRDIENRRRVRPDDVQGAMKTHLPPRRRIVTFVRPNPAAPRCGRLLEAT